MNSISVGEGAEENSIIQKFTNVVRISCLNFSGAHIQHVFFHFHKATPIGKLRSEKKLINFIFNFSGSLPANRNQ
jgi:hypothetical protein